MTAEHTHVFSDLVEVRRYPTSSTVGIFRCGCDSLFPRPITECEDGRHADCHGFAGSLPWSCLCTCHAIAATEAAA